MTSSGTASSSATASGATCVVDGSYDISYDVFLSFRGEDVRKNFADHLHTALKGIFRTFRDEEKIRMGEAIEPAISKAIKGSRVFIVIFSKNYANSGWCLNELEEIMECKRITGRKVFPIFYHVDPSDVCDQDGDYGTSFSLHEKNADEERIEKIKRWKAALRDAGNLKGVDVTTQYESRVIEKVIKDISNEMVPQPFIMGKLVGKESILKELIEFINIQPEDVRMIGIYGENGIGKTAIAQAICNEIFSQFEGFSFLANIRKVSKEYFGLQRLQKQLFRDILVLRGNQEIIFHRGNNVIKQICCRKVLIILDDVDDLKQLQFLAGEHKWFGKGSRIIITSIDKGILTGHGVELYDLKKLEDREGLSLFTQHAVNEGQPRCNFFALSQRAIECCHGLPLALKVLGSYLRGKTSKHWKNALEDLERNQGENIKKNLEDVIRMSCEGLGNSGDVFFDVACFFNGEHIDFVKKILGGSGVSSEDGIEFLKKRCLLSSEDGIEFLKKRRPLSSEDGIEFLSKRCLRTDSDRKLWMHNSIQDVGQEMVRQEKKKGERSRLWDHDDVRYVLRHNKGTNKIEGIFIELSDSQKLELSNEAFAKMTELRVLKIFPACKSECEEKCKVILSGDLVLSVSDLRYLHWHGYPLGSFPLNFLEADELLELHMRHSSLKHLTENEGRFPKLTVLDLSHSRNLVKISNFSTMPKLEKLILEGCTSLHEIDSSIGDLDKLIFLNLNGCKNLNNPTSSFCNLKSLETLIVSGCSIPEEMTVDLEGLQISGNQTKNGTATSGSTSQVSLSDLCPLKELDLSECHLREIPSHFWRLSSLERLNLRRNDFTKIPEGITQLSKLSVLQLGYCQGLQEIPNLPSTVQEVDAHGCSSLIPSSNFGDAITILRRIQNLAPNNEFCILLPGSGIPGCFGAKTEGCSVTIEKNQVNFLGFAVCCVFASECQMPEHTRVILCKINDFRFSYTFSCGRGKNEFVVSDHLWLAYQPRAQVENFHPYDWTQIKASFEVFGIGTRNKVKECAISLIR